MTAALLHCPKSVILGPLRTHETQTLDELAASASHAVGQHVSREEVKAAIEELRQDGVDIRFHEEVTITYWLESTEGEAA